MLRNPHVRLRLRPATGRLASTIRAGKSTFGLKFSCRLSTFLMRWAVPVRLQGDESRTLRGQWMHTRCCNVFSFVWNCSWSCVISLGEITSMSSLPWVSKTLKDYHKFPKRMLVKSCYIKLLNQRLRTWLNFKTWFSPKGYVIHALADGQASQDSGYNKWHLHWGG